MSRQHGVGGKPWENEKKYNQHDGVAYLCT